MARGMLEWASETKQFAGYTSVEGAPTIWRPTLALHLIITFFLLEPGWQPQYAKLSMPSRKL